MKINFEEPCWWEDTEIIESAMKEQFDKLVVDMQKDIPNLHKLVIQDSFDFAVKWICKFHKFFRERRTEVIVLEKKLKKSERLRKKYLNEIKQLKSCKILEK